MIKYEIKISQGKRPMPVAVFEDDEYELLGEFLTAEKSLRREVLSAVNEVDLNLSEKESFTGNAFTLEIGRETTAISNDINGDSLEVPTKDFKKILLDYIYAIRELKVKEKMASLGHNHNHNHNHID